MNASSQTSSGVMPLHQPSQARTAAVPPQAPYQALHQPRSSDAFPLSVSRALELARQDLAAQQDANIHEHHAMIYTAVTLELSLRRLVDALDADARGGAA